MAWYLETSRQAVLEKLDTEQSLQSMMHSFACTGIGATSTIIKMELSMLLKVYGHDRTKISITEELPDLAGAANLALNTPDGRLTIPMKDDHLCSDARVYYLDLFDGSKGGQQLHSLVVLATK